MLGLNGTGNKMTTRSLVSAREAGEGEQIFRDTWQVEVSAIKHGREQDGRRREVEVCRQPRREKSSLSGTQGSRNLMIL